MTNCMKHVLGILAGLLVAGVVSGAAWSASVNMPPPAQFGSQAEEHKQLTGAWCGKWANGPRIRLTVEKIADDGTATGVYRWGKKNNETDFKGRVKDHVLRITFPNSKARGGKWLESDVAIWLTGADQAFGTWKSNKSKRNKMAQLGTLTIEADRCN